MALREARRSDSLNAVDLRVALKRGRDEAEIETVLRVRVRCVREQRFDAGNEGAMRFISLIPRSEVDSFWTAGKDLREDGERAGAGRAEPVELGSR